MAGPLTERLQKKKQVPPTQPPPPEMEPPKKKKKPRKHKVKKDPVTKEPDPFYHRLRMFNGFDDGFHPTVELRVVRNDNADIIGIKQLWRKRRSDDFEWRNIKDFNVIIDNIPVPRPTVSEVLGTPAEVQDDPLASLETESTEQ